MTRPGASANRAASRPEMASQESAPENGGPRRDPRTPPSPPPPPPPPPPLSPPSPPPKNPTRPIFPPMPAPKKPGRAPTSKASRPEVHPLGEHLAALLNPALVEQNPQGFGQGFSETPQPKFETPAPESHPRGLTGATATIESLSKLLELGDPNIRDRPPWTPHRPPRPDKSEGGRRFRVVSEFEPEGDQPQA